MTSTTGAAAPVLTVVGAGPGIGAAAARRFGRAGYRIGLVARSQTRLDRLVNDLRAEEIDATAATADILQPAQLRRALDDLAAELGPTDVLLVSALPDTALIKPVLDTSAEDLLASLSLTVGGAAVAAQSVLPAMRRRGRGVQRRDYHGHDRLRPDAARRPRPDTW
jgi:NADP-dependent 3-hydroxy acid dehydrogenase YdfG